MISTLERRAEELKELARERLPPLVYARLPRAGLGNRLLVWGRALAFAHRNRLKLAVSPWGQLKIGPILRRERSTRSYFRYFDDPNSASLATELLVRTAYRRVVEPDVASIVEPRVGTAFVFDQIPHWSSYFEVIRDERPAVRAAFLGMVSASHRRALDARPAASIAVHVRQGDFRPLRPGEDFAKAGTTRAPLSYFREVIAGVRSLAGASVPVTLFSDGNDEDLAELLALPDLRRAPAAADVVDLVAMSRSRVLITAPGSSFSAWAGFVSEGLVLHHPDHFYGAAKPADVTARAYEGPVRGPAAEWPRELVDQLGRTFTAG